MQKIEYIERELNKFFDFLSERDTLDMMHMMFEVFELYDVDEDHGWLAECLKHEDVPNVRIIRTAYLLSKFADLYGGKLLMLKSQFNGLWKRLEAFRDE